MGVYLGGCPGGICLRGVYLGTGVGVFLGGVHPPPLPWTEFLTHTCYRPQRSCGQGNIFTCVCHSFCSQGGRGSASVHAGIPPPRIRQTPPEQTPPPHSPLTRQTPPPDQADSPPEQAQQTPPREADFSIRSMSGRWALLLPDVTEIGAFSLCYFFFTKAPSGPPRD